LSAELKQEFADVTWRQPARLRNRIVHGYWSIDLDVVHATAQEQLPGCVSSPGLAAQKAEYSERTAC
jgi:uncharacterized protein with HEPN domain